MTNSFLAEKLEAATTYAAFRSLMDALAEQGKTTGADQSESMVGYTKMNHQRIKRIEKTIILESDLLNLITQIDKKYVLLAIVEGWCGDVAQNLPVINKMVEATDKLELHTILRDDHLDLIDKYLTDGGRSIPKVIVLEADTLKEAAVWGPRPVPVQDMVVANKNLPEPLPYSEFSLGVVKWYNADKTHTLQNEWVDLVKNNLL